MSSQNMKILGISMNIEYLLALFKYLSISTHHQSRTINRLARFIVKPAQVFHTPHYGGRVTNFSSFHTFCSDWQNSVFFFNLDKLIVKNSQIQSVLSSFQISRIKIQYAMNVTIYWRIHPTSSILVGPTRWRQQLARVISKENSLKRLFFVAQQFLVKLDQIEWYCLM